MKSAWRSYTKCLLAAIFFVGHGISTKAIADTAVDVRPLNFEWNTDPGVSIPFTINIERLKPGQTIPITYQIRDIRQTSNNAWEWPEHTDSPVSCAPWVKLNPDTPKDLKNSGIQVSGTITVPAKQRGVKLCALLINIPTGGSFNAQGIGGQTAFVLQYVTRFIISLNGAPPQSKFSTKAQWLNNEEGLSVNTIVTNEGETALPISGHGVLIASDNRVLARLPISQRMNGQRFMNPKLYPGGSLLLEGDVPAPIAAGTYTAKTTSLFGNKMAQTSDILTIEKDITSSRFRPWHWTSAVAEFDMLDDSHQGVTVLENETDRPIRITLDPKPLHDKPCDGWKLEYPKQIALTKQQQLSVVLKATAPKQATMSCTFLLKGTTAQGPAQGIQATWVPPKHGPAHASSSDAQILFPQIILPVMNDGAVPIMLTGAMQASPKTNPDKMLNIELTTASGWRLLPGQEGQVIGDISSLSPGIYTGYINLTYAHGAKPITRQITFTVPK